MIKHGRHTFRYKTVKFYCSTKCVAAMLDHIGFMLSIFSYCRFHTDYYYIINLGSFQKQNKGLKKKQVRNRILTHQPPLTKHQVHRFISGMNI